MTRTLTDSTVGVFADQEADLVDQLCDLPAADCATVMRYFQQLNEPEPAAPETAREVHLSRTFDGTYDLRGTLDAEGGATLGKALDALVEESFKNDRDLARTVPVARRRADALIEMARRALGADPDSSSTARPAVTLTIPVELLLGDDPVDADPAGDRPGGPLIPVTTIIERALARRDGPHELAATDLTPAARRRLTCDAHIARLLFGPDSVPLDLGRSTRTPSPAQRPALAARDRGCTFPGCDRPPGWAEGHHIVHWTRAGPTDLENLCLLCSHHHHAIHDRGFSVTRRPDGTLHFTRPDGTELT